MCTHDPPTSWTLQLGRATALPPVRESKASQAGLCNDARRPARAACFPKSSWKHRNPPHPQSFLALREKTRKSPLLATPPRPWRAKKQRWDSGINSLTTGQKQERQPQGFLQRKPAASSTLSLIHQQPPRPHPQIPLGLPASVQTCGL